MAEEKTYCVYMHTSPSGKRYIGLTGQANPKYRWVNGHGYKKAGYFRNAIKKYGWDNIKHEILFSNLTKEEACRLEQICIVLFRTRNRLYGYNMTIGGECGSTGVTLTDEQRLEISRKLKGHPVSEETKKKISEKNTGRIVSEETRKRLSIISKGRKQSEETTKKMSEFQRKRYANMTEAERLMLSEKAHERSTLCIPVYCYETNKIYKSAYYAWKELGISVKQPKITACCRKDVKSVDGYHFCYAKDIDNYDFEQALTNNRHRKIYCYETDTVYPTSAQAAFELFGSRTDNAGIIRNCQGKQSECKSYHFCYAEERMVV